MHSVSDQLVPQLDPLAGNKGSKLIIILFVASAVEIIRLEPLSALDLLLLALGTRVQIFVFGLTYPPI